MARYEKLADLLGFVADTRKVADTGGGIEVLQLIRNDGKVIAVSEDAIALYPSEEMDPKTAEVALILDGPAADADEVTITEYSGPGGGWVKREAEAIAEFVGGSPVALKSRYLVAVQVQITKSNILELSTEEPLEGVALISRTGIDVIQGLGEADSERTMPDASIEFKVS